MKEIGLKHNLIESNFKNELVVQQTAKWIEEINTVQSK